MSIKLGQHCVGILYTQSFPNMAEPTFHKKITWAIMAHSPQPNFHKKIIYNFTWIYLGQHCVRKLPVECWPMANRQLLWKNNLYNVASCWDNIVKNIALSMLSKYVWDNIAQENDLCNVDPERTDILSQENRLFQIRLLVCFSTGYNITEQSWLFLFNVRSGVHLRLVGQQ